MRLGFILCLFLVPVFVSAHVPVVVNFERYEDTIVVEKPQVSHAYYGELSDFPHTYSFALETEGEVTIDILVPDIEEAKTNIGGIMVKELQRGVEEVVRFKPSEANWESFYEPFGGDSYRQGPTFKGVLEAGKYLVEVNTAENSGKYVLVIGEIEDFSEVGFFGSLKRIYQVKRFFGKSPLAVFQSPFYYVPTIIILLIAGFIWYRKKQKHA